MASYLDFSIVSNDLDVFGRRIKHGRRMNVFSRFTHIGMYRLQIHMQHGINYMSIYTHTHTHSRLTAFFPDYLGRPVPEG